MVWLGLVCRDVVGMGWKDGVARMCREGVGMVWNDVVV